MKKVELIIAGLAIIAITMNLFLVPGGTELTMMSLFALSGIYFCLSVALFNNISLRKVVDSTSYKDINVWRIIGAAGVGFGLASTLTGIIFKLLYWAGAESNLVAGLAVLLPAMIVGLVRYLKSRSVYYVRIFVRVAIIGGLGLILLLMPETAFMDFKYRNYPAFLEAMKNARANPGNEDLWKKFEEERIKMDEGKESE